MLKIRHLVVFCALLLIAATSSPAIAQGYPTKTVRIVVPYTPGGPADLLARGLAQKLSDAWGQPVIVDNRPGANEIIAAELVAKAPPDGYTFLLASDAVFSLNTYLYSKLPYDAVKNFTPVSKLVLANLMLVTRPDFPGKTVQDLVEHAKKSPGKLTYGSVGAGEVNHLAMSWLTTVKSLQMEHIPYKGLVQALQDIAAGRVDTMYTVIGGARPLIASGQIRGIAVSGMSRSPVLPDVPTFAEAGEPSLDASFYFGLAAPVELQRRRSKGSPPTQPASLRNRSSRRSTSSILASRPSAIPRSNLPSSWSRTASTPPKRSRHPARSLIDIAGGGFRLPRLRSTSEWTARKVS